MKPLEILHQRLSRRDLLKAGLGLVAGGGVAANEVRQERKVDAEVAERERTDNWVFVERNNSLARDRDLYRMLEQTRKELGLAPLFPNGHQEEPQEEPPEGNQA